MLSLVSLKASRRGKKTRKQSDKRKLNGERERGERRATQNAMRSTTKHKKRNEKTEKAQAQLKQSSA